MADFVGVRPTKGKEIAAMKQQSKRYSKKRRNFEEVRERLTSLLSEYRQLKGAPYEGDSRINGLLNQEEDEEHEPINTSSTHATYWTNLSKEHSVAELVDLTDGGAKVLNAMMKKLKDCEEEERRLTVATTGGEVDKD